VRESWIFFTLHFTVLHFRFYGLFLRGVPQGWSSARRSRARAKG